METKKATKSRKSTTAKPKVENRGGRREGAGRKKGVQIKENPRNKGITFMVSEKMLNQIRQLRELTREDEVNFNGMFVMWVEEMAQDYGIE